MVVRGRTYVIACQLGFLVHSFFPLGPGVVLNAVIVLLIAFDLVFFIY